MRKKEISFKSLKELRKKRGLTQRELAQLSGVSRAHINKIERGHLHLSKRIASKISSVFKVDYKTLIIIQVIQNLTILSESERIKAIKIALKEVKGLSPATKEIIKKIKNFDQLKKLLKTLTKEK